MQTAEHRTLKWRNCVWQAFIKERMQLLTNMTLTRALKISGWMITILAQSLSIFLTLYCSIHHMSIELTSSFTSDRSPQQGGWSQLDQVSLFLMTLGWTEFMSFSHFNSNFAFKRAKYVTLTFNYVAVRCAAQNSQAGLADILKYSRAEPAAHSLYRATLAALYYYLQNRI